MNSFPLFLLPSLRQYIVTSDINLPLFAVSIHGVRDNSSPCNGINLLKPAWQFMPCFYLSILTSLIQYIVTSNLLLLSTVSLHDLSDHSSNCTDINLLNTLDSLCIDFLCHSCLPYFSMPLHLIFLLLYVQCPFTTLENFDLCKGIKLIKPYRQFMHSFPLSFLPSLRQYVVTSDIFILLSAVSLHDVRVIDPLVQASIYSNPLGSFCIVCLCHSCLQGRTTDFLHNLCSVSLRDVTDHCCPCTGINLLNTLIRCIGYSSSSKYGAPSRR